MTKNKSKNLPKAEHYLYSVGWSEADEAFVARVAEFPSLAAHGDMDQAVPEPWQSSRLWLGVTLFGTGDFKTWKRNGH